MFKLVSMIIPLEGSINGRHARVRVTRVKPPADLFCELQTRGRWRWNTIDSAIPYETPGKDETVDELIDWGIRRLLARQMVE